MLNRLKISLFSRRELEATQPAPHDNQLPAGFQPVLTAEALVASESRQRSLRLIHQTMSMPAGLYDTFCYQPLCALLLRTQQVPATEQGIWARQGGFGDLTLQYTACAVRLAKGSMFPPGAAPEEQSAQSGAWSAVVFWAALFRHLPLLARMEGELSGGGHWLPGMTAPVTAYRCRFRQKAPSGAGAFAQASLIAAQLLPAEAVSWLSGTPPALHNLTGALWNGHPEMMLLRDILRQATEKIEAPSVATGSPSITAGAAALPPGVPAVALTPAVPAAELDITASPDAVTGTADILLSELASSMQPGGVETAPAEASPAMTVASSLPDDVASSALPETDASATRDETDMLLSLFSMVPDAAEAEATSGDSEDVPAAKEDPAAVLIGADVGEAGADLQAICDGPIIENNDPAPLPVPDVGGAQQAVATMPAMEDRSDVSAPEPVYDSPGSRFFIWLKATLRATSLEINTPDSKVHIVSGYVFIAVPDIFYAFITETGTEVDRRAIQASFERLGVHRIRGKERFIRGRVFKSEARSGQYSQLTGYLIKATSIYKGGQLPEDSLYILFQ
jgi:integrating conjugative element relaxase (TIGR03760 family)